MAKSIFPSLALTTALLTSLVGSTIINTASPIATITNGTYLGKTVPEWHQEHFLGIPYAQPPIGSLRFAWPQSLNTSFSKTRDATKNGYSCYQYGSDFNLSEDCLNLNVVRPVGTKAGDKLPVLVWVYGGGFTGGSVADQQYNTSGIAHVSQEIGKPVVVVSINYRLGVWGFLQTPQILAEGSSNAGLLDQRLAFRWIKENIAAFGGDPDHITVWGESAGAQSIGYHLYSYGGRNDGLFHAAIMESGGPVGASLSPLSYYTVPTENLTRTAGCWDSTDQLACLRSLSSEKLFASMISFIWGPIVDGDFLTAYPSSLAASGDFIKIPLLIGANTDEGTSFGVTGLNTEKDIFNNLLVYRRSAAYAISPPSARKLLELYPNDPFHEPPFYIKDGTIFPSLGLQWRRDCAISGDIVMIAQRRKLSEEFTKAGRDVFSYRWDTPLWNAAPTYGARHFVNVVFTFQNISGALGPLPQYQSYADLSRNIGRAYISFVYDYDPNTSRGNSSTLPHWPKYSLAKPQNLVLNSNKSFVEDDTWRAEGIKFINSINRELNA